MNYSNRRERNALYNAAIEEILEVDLQAEQDKIYFSPLKNQYDSSEKYFKACFPMLIEEAKANLQSVYQSDELKFTQSFSIIINGKDNGENLIEIEKDYEINSAEYDDFMDELAINNNMIVIFLQSYKSNSKPIPYIGLKDRNRNKDDKKRLFYRFSDEFCSFLGYKRGKITCKLFENLTSFSRRLRGLIKLRFDDNSIIKELVGIERTRHLYQENDYVNLNTKTLNQKQAECIDSIFHSGKRIHIIQGPPGTGKSHTLIHLIKTILQNKLLGKNEKILVCTPSNVILDHLIEKLSKEINIYDYLNFENNKHNIREGLPLTKIVRLGVVRDNTNSYGEKVNLEYIIDVLKNNNNGIIYNLNKKIKALEITIKNLHYDLARNKMLTDAESNLYSNGTKRLNLKKHELDQLKEKKESLINESIRFKEQKENLENRKADLLRDLKKYHAKSHYYYDNYYDDYYGSEDELVHELGSLQIRSSIREDMKITREIKAIKEYMKFLEDGKEKIRFYIKEDMIEGADIIFSTINSSFVNELIENMNVKIGYTIIDEVSQAVASEMLLALQCEPRHLVLFGDHKQLPATVFHKQGEFWNFNKSAIDILLERKYPYKMLNIQYRMKPPISTYSSRMFYDSKLLDSTLVNNKSYSPKSCLKMLKDYFNGSPLSFINVKGITQKNVKSSYNMEEVEQVMSCFQLIDDSMSVGIISPYKEQVHRIKSALKKKKWDYGVEVNSVDGFQGKEKDIIILSCVKSMDEKMNLAPLGFLVDQRRLNVAITRAKYALIIIGNRDTLMQNSIWRNYIKFIEKKGHYYSYES